LLCFLFLSQNTQVQKRNEVCNPASCMPYVADHCDLMQKTECKQIQYTCNVWSGAKWNDKRLSRRKQFHTRSHSGFCLGPVAKAVSLIKNASLPIAQEVEHLPCKCEVLSSNPSTTPPQKRNNNCEPKCYSSFKVSLRFLLIYTLLTRDHIDVTLS
jgi:hypothetical protein